LKSKINYIIKIYGFKKNITKKNTIVRFKLLKTFLFNNYIKKKKDLKFRMLFFQKLKKFKIYTQNMCFLKK